MAGKITPSTRKETFKAWGLVITGVPLIIGQRVVETVARSARDIYAERQGISGVPEMSGRLALHAVAPMPEQDLPNLPPEVINLDAYRQAEEQPTPPTPIAA